MAKRIQRTLCGQQLYATTIFWQFLIVTVRSAKNLLRSPAYTLVQLLITTILAVIIGLIYWELDTDPNSFTDRVGVFLFIVANQSFGSLGAIQLFVAQKKLFIHENASGYSRVSTFFISKVLTDLIALRFLPNTVFALITYFMLGLQIEVERFFIYWLVVMLVNIAAVSLAFFISAGVKNAELANSLITLPFIISLLFAGLLISLDSLPVWVSWVQYVSFMKYGLEALAINEMRGLRFQGPCEIQFVSENEMCNMNSTMLDPLFNDTCSSECAFDGLDQLSQLGYGNTSAILWWNVFSLVVYALVCMLLAYVLLRLIKKEK